MPRAVKKKEITEFIDNGVVFSPATPAIGDKLKVTYNGLLSKSGATDVIAHFGYGNKWEQKKDIRMNKTLSGFETTIPIEMPANKLNFCFKDAANNWDNNSGKNYSINLM